MAPNLISLTVHQYVFFSEYYYYHVVVLVVFFLPMHARQTSSFASLLVRSSFVRSRFVRFNSISISNFYKFAFRSYVFVVVCFASIFLHNVFCCSVLLARQMRCFNGNSIEFFFSLLSFISSSSKTLTSTVCIQHHYLTCAHIYRRLHKAGTQNTTTTSH